MKTEPPTLGDISYADARSGQIRFAAVKKNPAVREVAKIRVAWQGDETKKGEKEIAVFEQTLKIVMIGPREVRPLIPEEIIKLPGNQGSIIPFRAMTELRVSLTYKGSQRAGHQYELSSNYVDGSGGHDHVTDRRTRNLDNYGSFSLKSNIPSRASNPYQGTTTLGEDGNLVYTASVFGDRMLFRVQSKQNRLLWDTLSIAEKVELLEDFAEAPPAGYWNLTGNTGRTSYRKCRGTLIEHARNHYGSPLLVEQLQAAVLDFFDWSATEEGGDSPLKLGINDMSLEHGGLFDICGDWLPGHWYHRTGASVDIEGDAEQYDSPGDYVQLQAYQVKKLTSIMGSRKGKRYPEASIHYGFGGH